MSEMPRWLKEYRKRARFMDILAKAFETNCDCDVCKELREWAKELDEELAPSLPATGAKKSKKKKR